MSLQDTVKLLHDGSPTPFARLRKQPSSDLCPAQGHWTRRQGASCALQLLLDCLDAATGEVHPVTIVSDNGPAFKSTEFLRFIRSRPELAHVRTRHHAPETNGVVERFNGSLKYEHLYREEIADAAVLTEEVERFREIYNRVRPHEALGFLTPEGCRADAR